MYFDHNLPNLVQLCSAHVSGVLLFLSRHCEEISSQHTNSPDATKIILSSLRCHNLHGFFFLNLKIFIGLNFGLAAVDWPWLNGTIAVHGSGTVILAMYTFIVGPWLPTSSAIFVGLIHKPALEKKH